MEILENILKDISSDQIVTIFIFSYIFIILNDILSSMITYIQDKAWLVNDYEKIIGTYLNICDVDDNKEKQLIANAKIRLEKRKAKMEKIKRIFRRINKKNK